jgi:hypothetical protein
MNAESKTMEDALAYVRKWSMPCVVKKPVASSMRVQSTHVQRFAHNQAPKKSRMFSFS